MVKSTKIYMSVCYSRTKDEFFLLFCGWHQNGWTKAETGHVEEIGWKNVDVDEPTSFLDHVYIWSVINVNAKPNEIIIEEYTKIFESRRDGCVVLRHGTTRSKMRWEILRAGKQKSGTALQSFKAWMIINSSRKNSNQWENCHKCAHNLSEKSLYLPRVGRPDISWSVNKFARAVTKWIQPCDRRLARLISYIRHTNDYRQ